ncbi:SDR family oxidoreductase [Kitasatospora sp. NBC_01287]|uniref:SDR family oxidoreductase n=1 Tax=Kitasatospora sp. NBC_01287 TaxID=2903573 RepID=UPI00224FFFF2|nr:SDR family oxidoreductase [Kitasatospora sp. NBC_01287]MCX4746112.1 SDR family oxidoreductase [Kitasatospora sp. NBC_01287]
MDQDTSAAVSQRAPGSPLAGRTAIVTGGSRGIGGAIVRRLAADGAAVVFNYSTNEAPAKEVVAEVAAAGGTAWAVQAELGSLDQIEGLFTAADQHFAEIGADGLDILVNSAGTFVRTPFGETSEAAYDEMMAINAKAPFFTMQHAVRRLRDGGRIINLSTVTTRWPRVHESAYIASKAALEQFSWVATRELGGRGITVNVVSPGPTDSGAGGMLQSATTDAIRAEVANQTPLNRLGLPTDIAAVVAFLAGPDGGWVNGQNIRADGGLVW